MSNYTNNQIIEIILHYQKSIERYTRNNNEEKILHCLNKLRKLPIKVCHLEETGIGRTVNGLRKFKDEVGEASRSLVSKWKNVVVEEESPESASEESGVDDNHVQEDKYESRDNSVERKENISKSSSSDKQKHKKHDDVETKNEIRHKEHKSVKRKHEDYDNEANHASKHKKSKKSHDDDKNHNKHKKHEHSSKELSKHSESKLKEKDSKQKDKSSKSMHEHNESKSSRHREKSDTESKKTHKKEKTKRVTKKLNDGIDSGSGASFAEALGMLEPCSSKTVIKYKKVNAVPEEKKSNNKMDNSSLKIIEKPIVVPATNLKQLEPLDISLSSLLPQLTPNYRPLGLPVDLLTQKQRQVAEDEALSYVISSKNQRTKVYSGNKCYQEQVPTLFEICTRILQDNIDALEYTGGVPYLILKPILEKATVDQLFMMEHHNPYLIEDTDELWKLHCQKDFRTKQREEMETWRDMYMRCLDEREAKLKILTANIKQAQDKSIPVRQTKLAYVDSVVKPPRSVARKQAKNGIFEVRKPAITPASRLASLATAGSAGQIAVPNPGHRAVSTGAGGMIKPKKAPLMQKTLALIKSRFRR